MEAIVPLFVALPLGAAFVTVAMPHVRVLRRLTAPLAVLTVLANLVLAVLLSYGAWRVSQAEHTTTPGPVIGVVQENVPISFGSSVSDAREKFKYDLFYVKNGKFAFDIFVLAQTVEIVLWRRGLSMSGQLENNVVELPTAQLPYLHRRQDKVG